MQKGFIKRVKNDKNQNKKPGVQTLDIACTPDRFISNF